MSSSSRSYPAHIAFFQGDFEETMRLIESKEVDINAQDSHGNTLLFLSLHYGHTVLTSRFLKAGAKAKIINKYGDSAYSLIRRNAIIAEKKMPPPYPKDLANRLYRRQLDEKYVPPEIKVAKLAEIQKLTENKKPSRDDHSIIFELYTQAGELDQSCVYLEKVLETDPTDLDAAYNLFKRYQRGFGEFKNETERDKRSIALLRSCMKAEDCNSRAERDLGLLVYESHSAIRNETLGLKYLLSAARAGNLTAQVDLARIMILYPVKNRDPKFRAKLHDPQYWLKKAIKKNDPSAQYYMAMLLLSGNGVEENEEEAIQLLKLAIAQNFPPAYALLGNCYKDGIEKILPKDELKAKKYLKKAGLVPKALFELAMIDLQTPEDDSKKLINRLNGFNSLFCLAMSGLSIPMLELGLCYLYGKGVIADENAAYQWMKFAAMEGLCEAQFQLGTWLAAKQGGELPKKWEAKKWLKMASDSGHADATLALEKFLTENRDIRRDPKLESPMQGTKPKPVPVTITATTIEIKEPDGKDEKIEKKQEKIPSRLKRLKHKAREENDSIAQYELGLFYKNVGAHQKAKHYLSQAAQQNHVKAKEFLQMNDMEEEKPHTIDENKIELIGTLHLLPKKFHAAIPFLQDFAAELLKVDASYCIKGSTVPVIIKKMLGKNPPSHPTRPHDIDLEIDCVELNLSFKTIEDIALRFGFAVTYSTHFNSMELVFNRIIIQLTTIISAEYELVDLFKPTQPRIKVYPDGRLEVTRMSPDNLQNYLNNIFEIDQPLENKRYTYFFHRLSEALIYYQEDIQHDSVKKFCSVDYALEFLQATFHRCRYDFYGEIAMLIKYRELSSPLSEIVLTAFATLLFEHFEEKMRDKKWDVLLKKVPLDKFIVEMKKNLLALKHPQGKAITSYICYISSAIISTFNAFYSDSMENQNQIYQNILVPSFEFIPPRHLRSNTHDLVAAPSPPVQLLHPALITHLKSFSLFSEKISKLIADYAANPSTLLMPVKK